MSSETTQPAARERNVSPDLIKRGTSDVCDATLSLPADLVAPYDGTWRRFPDLLTHDKPLTPDEVVDARFQERASQY